MRFWRYTAYLEGQVRYFQDRLENLEKRNQELVLSLFSKGLTPPEVKPQKKHDIQKKNETSASCICGWNFASDDPATLQMAISEHYRDSVITGGRRKWAHMRDDAEEKALQSELKENKNAD